MWNRAADKIVIFSAGFFLDLIFGDPYRMPHPVRLMGRLINGTERMLRGRGEAKGRGESVQGQIWLGMALVVIVLVSVACGAWVILRAAYGIHRLAGMGAEILLTYQIFAAKCLRVESMKVYDCLKAGDLAGARAAVSMIVGRDTDRLDEEGVAKAAIETVAENTSDGVIAPMVYTALGGPLLGLLYKAVNTMDSMVGYKNERYLYFGRAAAKLDDLVNYIPARVSAWLMICGAFLLGKEFSGSGAIRIYWRDRRKHASPNSAHTESVCAGALGVRLAGDGRYFGKLVRKPFIGDGLREVECEDIRRANGLMGAAGWICWGICVGVILVRDGGIFCW